MEDVIKLDEKKQKVQTVLSKIVYIVSKILQVLSCIGASIGVILIIVIPLILNYFHFEEGKVIFGDNDFVVNYSIPAPEISFEDESGNVQEFKVRLDEIINGAIRRFEKIDSSYYIILFELLDIFFIASSVIMFLVFGKVYKLFKNIASENSPFKEENALIIRKIAMLYSINVGIIILKLIVLDAFLGSNSSSKIDINMIVLALIIWIVSYIFEYGAKLEKLRNVESVEKVDE